MAYTAVPGGLWVPNKRLLHVDVVSTNLLMDATGERVGFFVVVPKSGTLDKFECLTNTFTQATNGIRFSFQDPDGTGFPDGTQDQFRDVASGSLASNSWIVPGLMTDDGTDTGVKRSVTKGQKLWCVIDFVSFAASDAIRIATGSFETSTSDYAETYAALRAGAGPAWTRQTAAPMMSLKYDDGTYGEILCPGITAITQTSFNSGSTPDERGLYFSLPMNCKIDAIGMQMAGLASGRTFDVVLYDTDGTTVIETISWDSIYLSTLTGTRLFYFFLTQERTLTANGNYRITLKPTTASNNALVDVTANAAGNLAPYGSGQLTTRTDGGAWTQTATRRPLIGVRVSSVDDGSAGSSSYAFLTQSPSIQFGRGMVPY